MAGCSWCFANNAVVRLCGRLYQLFAPQQVGFGGHYFWNARRQGVEVVQERCDKPPAQITRSVAGQKHRKVRDLIDGCPAPAGHTLPHLENFRGAGNLLGAQQHGFITAVGFDLYCRLLEEAVRELKGERVEPEVEPDVKISVTAYIPDDYIPDTDMKMEFYQRLADARRIVDLLAVKEELVDRFGRPPFQVSSLLNIMEIKIMARQVGLDAVQLERSRFRMIFPEDLQVTPADIQRLVERSSSELEFNITDRLVIETFIRADDEQERLEKARSIIEELL